MDGSNSFLYANGVKINQFKAKDSVNCGYSLMKKHDQRFMKKILHY